MTTKNTGLVLEGGGLRGVYSSGVLRFFMEKNLVFPYVIGASMGACNLANYVSNQPERNRIVNIRFVNDQRYLSYLRLLAKGELFGMEFIFNELPKSVVPFDFETFSNSSQKCLSVTTDCLSGEPVYYEKAELGENYMKILQASSSLPLISKPVSYNGKILLDGGISDSIPIEKSISDGNRKNVIILTREKGYRKNPEHFAGLVKVFYPEFKGLATALKKRHSVYNKTLDLVESLRKEKRAYVIRPSRRLKASRVGRNKDNLYETYDQGYEDAKASYCPLMDFLEEH